MTPIAEAAAFLAAEWRVFPVRLYKAGNKWEKQPLVKWRAEASRDPQAVRDMFCHPSANAIGVPMGPEAGVFLLDIDPGKGGNAWLEANWHRLPRTRTHRTVSGGLHLLFRWPAGRIVRNTTSEIANGVDTKCEGGFAMFPPSPGYGIEDDAMPADAPEWLLDLLAPKQRPEAPREPYQPPTHDRASRYAEAALDAECQAVAGAAEGGRNHQLNISAVKLGGLVAAGALSESTVRAVLRRAALHAGLEPRETDLTIQSGLSHGMQTPRQIPERAGTSPRLAHVAPSAPATGSGQPTEADDKADTEADSAGLPLVYLDDIEPCLEANDFVEGVLVAQSAAVIYGESNAGKTFLATDLALSVAAGQEWFGKAVEQGGVVYCVLEGGQGFRNRVRAWLDFNGQPNTIPFAAIPASINLLDPEADTERLIDAIQAAAKHLGKAVKLVVIDTLARAFAGGNENSSEDMGQLVLNMDKIRARTGAAVLFIHHSGKDQAKGARGHSSLRAAIDTEIEVKAPEDEGPRTATVAKQRELPKGDVFSFGLKVIELGKNKLGKPVTTCVITPADKPADTGPKMSDGTKKALSALDEVTGQSGQAPMSADIPKWARIVKLSAWRREFLRRSGESTEAAAERAFSRARKYLESVEKIGIRDGWVWRTDANKPL